MKILFDLYNDLVSTESSYLYRALSQAGADVYLWENKNISAFDIFDSVNPNVFVSHYKNLNIDVLKRMSESTCGLVLNVSGITENEAKNLEQTLAELNIKCSFVFYNHTKPSGFDKIKCIQIMSAADVFIPTAPPGNRQIKWGIVSDAPNLDVSEDVGDIYHKIHAGSQAPPDFDVAYGVVDLNRVSSIYENILLSSDDPSITCGQMFFDMTLRLTGKCAVSLTDTNKKDIGNFMQSIFPDLPEDPAAAKTYLISTILRKHTCVNRAERFAQNLDMPDELLVNLRKIQDSLKINLQNSRS